MDRCETASIIASLVLAGIVLLAGFVVVGISFGRVGVVIGVDVPIIVGEELLLIVIVVIVVVGVVTIVVFRLLLIPIISISRPTTIAAILLFNRFSLSIVMDNAQVFDLGKRSWTFVLTLLAGYGDLVLDRFRDDRVLVLLDDRCGGGGGSDGLFASSGGDGGNI